MKYYTIEIPTKPYLYKYISTLEGSPIFMNSDSLFCILIATCLGKKVTSGLSDENRRKRISAFTEKIKVKIPISNMARFGFSLSEDHLVILNRHLEKSFERELVTYCRNFINESVRYSGYKEAYESFSNNYNIDLEIDIPYDTLKKTEYRARKRLKRKAVQNVPSRNRAHTSLLLT